MKKIKIPIDTTVFCQIDLKNINSQNVKIIDGMRLIPLAQIDVSKGSKEIETARDNGAQIVYALLSIEHKIENVLAEYLFGPTLGIPKPKKDFFVNEIVQSNKFDYSFKKELLNRVINLENLLDGKDKDILQNNLKKIMTWRNAFAHGHLLVDNSQICYLEYYAGGKSRIILNDKFWTEVESSFSQTDELLKKIKLDNEERNIA